MEVLFFFGETRFLVKRCRLFLVPKLHELMEFHRKQMTSIPTQLPNLTQEKGHGQKMQAYECKPMK